MKNFLLLVFLSTLSFGAGAQDVTNRELTSALSTEIRIVKQAIEKGIIAENNAMQAQADSYDHLVKMIGLAIEIREESSLHDIMEAVGKNTSALIKNIQDQVISDTELEPSLSAAQTLESLSLEAATKVPEKVKGNPKEVKAQLFEYVSLLVKLTAKTQELEDAIKKQDGAQAFEHLRAMMKIRKEGHSIFK